MVEGNWWDWVVVRLLGGEGVVRGEGVVWSRGVVGTRGRVMRG